MSALAIKTAPRTITSKLILLGSLAYGKYTVQNPQLLFAQFTLVERDYTVPLVYDDAAEDVPPTYQRIVELNVEGLLFHEDRMEYDAEALNAALFMVQGDQTANSYGSNNTVDRHPACDKIVEIWRRWNHNGMRPGTKEQMDFLHNNELFTRGVMSDARAVALLKNEGLYEVPHPYSADAKFCYGAAYLYEPLPQDVVAFIQQLPDDGTRYLSVRKLLGVNL